MGMYNEVYKSCPECGARCEVQISQVVLGFGEFDLDDPHGHTITLDPEQKLLLKELVEQKQFNCEKCYYTFEVEVVIVDRKNGNRVEI
jgi:hypothetical protein